VISQEPKAGDDKVLDCGTGAWCRGSKRGFRTKKQFAGPNEVGRFATIRGSHRDDGLETCARLIHHVRE
jgi:hypothetical protein